MDGWMDKSLPVIIPVMWLRYRREGARERKRCGRPSAPEVCQELVDNAAAQGLRGWLPGGIKLAKLALFFFAK